MRFSISGEFLTENARDLVLSEQWREGLNFLVDSLEGLTMEMAISILKGEKRLVGKNEEMDLVDEEPEVRAQYEDDVYQIYKAGRLRYDGKRYIAYGYVRNVTSYDSERAREDILHRASRFKDWPRQISTYYMYNPKSDLVFPMYLDSVGRNVSVLFEPDTSDIDLPLWMTGGISQNPEDAVKDVPLSDIGPNLERPRLTMHALTTGQVNPSDIEECAVKNETLAKAGLSEPSAPYQKEERDPLVPDVIDSFNQNSLEAYLKETYHMDIPTYSSFLRNQILHKLEDTGEEWCTYKSENGRILSYPKNLTLAYALSRTNAQHLAPKWDALSPRGSKMESDSPIHTDLWLALGFDLGWTVYSHVHPDHQVFNELTSHVQKEFLNYKVQVLTSGGQRMIYGTVRTPDTFKNRESDEDTVLVVPHAGVEFETMAFKSKAVICAQGGKLAHLVTVGRELSIPIVRDDDALRKYRSGQSVVVDLNNGTIDIHAGVQIGFGADIDIR